MKKEYKKYMSYFQKVTTVGVVTCAKNIKEAEAEAEQIVKNSNPVERCFYDETPFTLSDTEEWNPDIEILSVDPSKDNNHLDFTVKVNDEYSLYIAKACGKSVEDLTNEDFEKFFVDSISEFISKGEKKYGETLNA